MAGCGYTPDAIDTMPMQDALSLMRYWRDHPPANEILAAVYGVKPAVPVDPEDPSGIGALMTRWPEGKVSR